MEMITAQEKMHGTITNTFAELEAGCAESLKGRKWLVGPASICNRDAEESTVTEGEESRNLGAFMEWLDGRSSGSVLYACFGSLGKLTRAQVREIAEGLADADRPFLWVIRDAGDSNEWILEGFEEKGLIVRGWAPQWRSWAMLRWGILDALQVELVS